MRLLLDTEAWLWMQTAPSRLGEEGQALVREAGNELFLSAASAWEIAVKHALGRLPLPEPPERYVPDRMRRSGVEGLVVRHAHALGVASLPPHHRDPFDRLLVVQASTEGLVLLTADPVFARYDVEMRRVG